jgi:hypothetical protein
MKTRQEKPVRVPMTKEDVARIMSAVAKELGGHIPKDSYVASLQRAEAKRAALKRKGVV